MALSKVKAGGIDNIAAALENASDSNKFTDADHSKLNAIEASATADQTAAQIKAGVEAASDSNTFTDADHSKLNAIEASATADQTNAQIRTAIEAASDSNVFTDADHSKLNAVEANATADQTVTQIKTALENGIDSVHYVNGSIDTEHIGNDQVTADKLANSINSAITANTSKTTNATHSGEVTGSGALTITNGAVTSEKIASNIALGGNPTTTTQTAANNSTRIATTAYTDAAIAALSDSAPGTLNTLNELAAALGDDANYATTTTNAIAAKMPLAGGTLTGNLNLGDSVRARFGASNDLQIFHDASNSYIENTGTGDLIIQDSGGDVRIKGKSNEDSIVANNDGSVDLYYDNAKKFETTAAGITVTGGASIDGAVVINESGADKDFRVESDTKTHAIFVDGANGHVGINTNEPNAYVSYGHDLVVYSTGTTGITIATNDTSAETALCFADSNSGDARGQGAIVYQNASDQMRFTIGGNTYPMSLKYGTGGVRINTSTYAGRNFGGDTFDITFSALPTRTGNSWSVINFVLVYSSIGGGAEGPVNSMALLELRGLSAWNAVTRVNISSGHSTVAAIVSSSTTGCVVRISGMASNSAGHYQIQTVGGENTAVSLGF